MLSTVSWLIVSNAQSSIATVSGCEAGPATQVTRYYSQHNQEAITFFKTFDIDDSRLMGRISLKKDYCD